MKVGDIYIYSNKGKVYPTSGRPVGCALVVEVLKEDDAGNPLWVSVRNAHNLTTYRVYPDQLAPVPVDVDLNSVLISQFVDAIGEGGRDHFDSILKTYRDLVAEGSITEINEVRIVRVVPALKP